MTTRKVEQLAQRESEKAKQLLSEGKRDKALYCLKRRKAQELKLASIRGMLDNVHEMLASLDFAKIEADVVASMKAGTDALNVLHKHMQAEDVEKIMDNAFDAIHISREVSDLLGQQLSAVDEEAILAEMAAWERPLKEEKGINRENESAGGDGASVAALAVPTHPVQSESDSVKGVEPEKEGRQAVVV
jgi:charged multivesicular body protein 6